MTYNEIFVIFFAKNTVINTMQSKMLKNLIVFESLTVSGQHSLIISRAEPPSRTEKGRRLKIPRIRFTAEKKVNFPQIAYDVPAAARLAAGPDKTIIKSVNDEQSLLHDLFTEIPAAVIDIFSASPPRINIAAKCPASCIRQAVNDCKLNFPPLSDIIAITARKPISIVATMFFILTENISYPFKTAYGLYGNIIF